MAYWEAKKYHEGELVHYVQLDVGSWRAGYQSCQLLASEVPWLGALYKQLPLHSIRRSYMQFRLPRSSDHSEPEGRYSRSTQVYPIAHMMLLQIAPSPSEISPSVVRRPHETS